jgi:acyl-CoA synthetase (AMP-forming)/AMP-acid ligase II
MFCKLIQDYKVNVIPIVPPIVLSLVNNYNNPNCSQYDLSSLQFCLISASPLSEELAENFTYMFNVPIRQCYGLTETTTTGSIGKILPNIECKIIDEKGEELEYNQPGELCIRCPYIMKGYLNDKEGTNKCIDSEGWLRTGDLATVDKSGG